MLPSKWRQFESSIFSKMSLLAQQYNAVNLAQGFPDFDGPELIKEAAIQAIRQGQNQYAPSPGVLELRQALATHQQQQYSLEYDPHDEITIFSGATEAIYCTITALCGEGDEVVTFEPFYDSYPVATMVAGARFRTIPLEAPDWSFDLRALRAVVNERTRLLILNTPHNPTGRCFKRDELLQIAQLAKTYNFYVMTDEVYEELVFSPARHMPIATLPGMRDRTIVISSSAKTFSFTGWKVGYAFAPAYLTKAIRVPHQYTVFCSATPLQHGMTAAFKLGPEYYHVFREEYAERRAALFRHLREAGFECIQPDGSYFILADYRRLLDVPDIEFAEWLTREVGVACVPISVFYTDSAAAAQHLRYVRFAFCKDLATIETAGERFRTNLRGALERYHD
jgi:N-succinyldiaminopimelate aminotransferase